MNMEAIRALHHAEPFRPFYVFLADGRKILVKQPENMGYSPTGKAMAIYTRPEIAESMCADDIVKLEPAKRPHAKKNGR